MEIRDFDKNTGIAENVLYYIHGMVIKKNKASASQRRPPIEHFAIMNQPFLALLLNFLNL
jgi:hypothetical protein